MSDLTLERRAPRAEATAPPTNVPGVPPPLHHAAPAAAGGEASVASAEAMIAERRRLARELHDGPVQSLWFLGAEIRRLQALAAGASSELCAGLQALQATWAQVYDELRQTTGDLHQPLPPDNALVRTLERSLANLAQHTGIATELETELDADRYPLARTTEAQLVRICQAALGNVRRHAKAERVHVHVRVDAAGALLCIEDDGVGFEPGEVSARSTEQYGLAMMRERAEALGGQVELISRPGHGTVVRVWVPVHKARAGRARGAAG